MVQFLNDASAAFFGGFYGWNYFSGRTRRRDYWLFVLVSSVFALLLGLFGVLTMSHRSPFNLFNILYTVFGVLLFVPSLAVGIRRLHDIGRSGWWILLQYVPLGGFVLLYFWCLDSQPGENKWGASPKEASGLSAPAEAW